MLKLRWPKKILLYSIIIAVVSISLTALATVQTAARLWEQEFLRRNTAYSTYTSLDVLRTFAGRFSGESDPQVVEAIRNLKRSNGDLISVQILTESGRELFSTAHPDDGSGGEEGNLSGRSAWYEGIDKAVQAVIGSTEAMARPFKVRGRRLLDVLAPVTGLGGSRPVAVRYLYTYTSLENKTKNLIERVVFAAVVLILAVAAFSVYLSRNLTRPISLLSASARRIASGDRGHRIELRTGDEVEELARQFNEMVQSLERQRGDLEEANRELTEANLRLTELQDQLVRTERLAALGQLSAGVSHELDNPVGVILGYAELTMEETEPEEGIHEYAAIMREEARRCKRIIAGLLDFSRPSSGVARVLNLGELIREVAATLQDQRPFRKIHWDLDPGTGTSPVHADPDSLRQILVNLSLNASQAMAEGGVIAVGLTPAREPAGDGWLIRFSDTGSGIRKGDEERIFDPFYTTKRRGEGTGLGLSICRKLVEEMGGWIRAVPGEGGVFEIWLPQADTEITEATM